MSGRDQRILNQRGFGVARMVSTAVGAGLILYGMKRSSWFGRLIMSAGLGLVSKSIGTEGAMASVLASIRGRLENSQPKRLQASR